MNEVESGFSQLRNYERAQLAKMIAEDNYRPPPAKKNSKRPERDAETQAEIDNCPF
jgi:hypothetical protein